MLKRSKTFKMVIVRGLILAGVVASLNSITNVSVYAADTNNDTEVSQNVSSNADSDVSNSNTTNVEKTRNVTNSEKIEVSNKDTEVKHQEEVKESTKTSTTEVKPQEEVKESTKTSTTEVKPQEEVKESTEASTTEVKPQEEVKQGTENTTTEAKEQDIKNQNSKEEAKVSEIDENTPEEVVEQPGTTSGIDVNKNYELKDGKFIITYSVSEDFEDGEFKLDLGKDVMDTLNEYANQYGYESYPLQPGDSNAISIEVKFGNNHTYVYKDGSFSLKTQNTADKDNLTEYVGFDEQKIPLTYVGALSKSKPMLELYGVTSSGKVTVDMVANTYKKLADKGYTGDNALTDYILNYYNNQLGTNYESVDALQNDKPAVIVSLLGGAANNQFNITEDKYNKILVDNPDLKDHAIIKDLGDGKIQLQFKWDEQELAAATYNNFYKYLLAFDFGDEESQKDFLNSHGQFNNLGQGVRDYMDNYNDIWEKTNEYFKHLSSDGTFNKDGNSSANINVAFGIDGPWTNNAYQNYELGWENSVKFEQIDGNVKVQKVDKETGTIIEAPATFNLYYIVKNDETTNTPYYYAVDAEGKTFFTEDVSKAAQLVTENGSFDVKYLLPGEYFIKNTITPEGYLDNDEELSFNIVSKDTIVVVSPAEKIKPEKEPEKEPTKDPEKEPEKEPAKDPVKEPEKTPVNNSSSSHHHHSTSNVENEEDHNEAISGDKENISENPIKDDSDKNLSEVQKPINDIIQTNIPEKDVVETNLPEIINVSENTEETIVTNPENSNVLNCENAPKTGDNSIMLLLSAIASALCLKKTKH